MLRKLSVVIMLMMTGFIPSVSSAATGDHGLPGEYLQYDIGARAAGMGGAMTGLADDVTAMFYNPAGLAFQNPIQFGLQHVLLFENTMFDFLGFSMPVMEIGYIGLGAVMLNSTNFIVVEESYKPRSIANSISQGAAYISYARDIIPGVAAGANVKVAYENIFGHSGTGIGIDVGGIYTPIPEFQAGLYVNNALAPSVLGDTYPIIITLGLAGKFFNDDLRIDADIYKALANQSIKWKTGAEVAVYEDMAFVRAGLDDEMRVCMGAGGQYMNVRLDYAASLEILGLVHKISLGYSMGGFEMSLTANPKIFSPVGINKNTTFGIKAVSKYPIREWEFNIKDQNGDVVRAYSGEDNPPNQIVWNGKDDRGLPAPDGNFSAQLVITDANGKVLKSNFESVKIQSAVPLGGESGLDLQ